ncbi:MAG: hypothetical protein IT307_03250, partial [Chloroflexi bacterium]|nr:hypothetical protein [Chloroflexota bacterium]
MKRYSNRAVELIAETRIAQLERVLGSPVTPPISVDLVGEQVLGLDFMWDEIEELPGEVILGGLQARERLIVLNERHRPLFTSKPGLERSTKGHEMGHWDLFVDRSLLDQPGLPGLDLAGGVVFRGSPAGSVAVLSSLVREPAFLELVREMDSRADDPAEARAVNRYAAALSMP